MSRLRASSYVVFLTLGLVFTGSTDARAQSILGDCNCSGALDAADPLCVVLRLVGAFTPETCPPPGGPDGIVCFAAADPGATYQGEMTASAMFANGTDADAARDSFSSQLLFADSNINDPVGGNGHTVTYDLIIPETADYFLWAHFYYPGTPGTNDANSFHARIDGGVRQEFGNNKDFFQLWHYDGDGDVSQGAVAGLPLGELTAGPHQLVVEKREVVPIPPRVDVICFTQDGVTPPTDAEVGAALTGAVCGNGVVEGGEDCDFGDLDGGTCETEGLFGDGLACSAGCEYDTSACSATCGDGVCDIEVDVPDNCLADCGCQATACSSTFFGLCFCDPECVQFDDCCPDACDACGLCEGCGDGVVGVDEDCDVGDLNGGTCATEGLFGEGLTCGTGCQYDTSACSVTRFENTGLGTVIDHMTHLEWQMTDDAGGLTDKDNLYTWTADGSAGTAPNGTAFSVFLAGLNNGVAGVGGPTTGCFTDRCDWRMPVLEELQTIRDCAFGAPCIDQSLFGPIDAPHRYWSSTSFVPPFEDDAWFYCFEDNTCDRASTGKNVALLVRAVRGGP